MKTEKYTIQKTTQLMTTMVIWRLRCCMYVMESPTPQTSPCWHERTGHSKNITASIVHSVWRHKNKTASNLLGWRQ